MTERKRIVQTKCFAYFWRRRKKQEKNAIYLEMICYFTVGSLPLHINKIMQSNMPDTAAATACMRRFSHSPNLYMGSTMAVAAATARSTGSGNAYNKIILNSALLWLQPPPIWLLFEWSSILLRMNNKNKIKMKIKSTKQNNKHIMCLLRCGRCSLNNLHDCLISKCHFFLIFGAA